MLKYIVILLICCRFGLAEDVNECHQFDKLSEQELWYLS